MLKRPRLPALLREIHDLRDEGVLKTVLQAAVVGGGSGFVIGLFRLLYSLASARTVSLLRGVDLESWPVFAAVFGILLLLSLIVGCMVLREPLISGSGIPHVELALLEKVPMPWLRILVGKFFGTLFSLAGGLSVGREGPSIQMGAAVGAGFGKFWHCCPSLVPRYLIGGSVAGLAAAFGAPFAAVIFAFEEVKTILSAPLILFTCVAGAAAWLVVSQVFGFGLVFPFADIAGLTWRQYWMLPVIGVVMGGLGALYNKILLSVTYAYDRQTLLPTLLKPLPPFLISGALLYFYPQVLSGVGIPTDALAAGSFAASALLLLLLVKIAFSVVSFASGVPGGLLMPMLTIGGIAGALLSALALHFSLAAHGQQEIFLVLCMSGLFAGTVRAPVTGAVLVMEMSGTYHCLLGLVVVALVAAFTANRLGSAPVYDSLKERLLASWEKKERHDPGS